MVSGAMLSLPLENGTAAAFYAACKYTVDPLSPSRIEPTSEVRARPEIVCSCLQSHR